MKINKMENKELKNITSMWTDISIKHGVDAQNNKDCMLIYVENTKGNFVPTVCRNGQELIEEIKKILLHINYENKTNLNTD